LWGVRLPHIGGMMCVVACGRNPEVGMSNGNGSPHAEPKIGRTLELARKEQGLSLHQVEQETKIRTRYLRELERENFDVLPAVYVQGSLKTYANFLGLDGEALTRELRRRQPPEDEPEAPTTHIEPPRSDYLDRYLISVGGAVGAEDQEVAEDEESAGATTVPANNYRLYLGSAAFLVLILAAVALVLTLPRDSQPAVSEVREPLISQAPSEVSSVGDEENNPVSQQEDGESDDLEPKQQASSPDEDAREDGGAGEPAQGPRDATATPSAPAAAETASAQPDATPAPTTEEPATTRPAPAASETLVRDDQGVVGGLRARGPVQKNDEGPVKNFSITREKNATVGNTSGSCPRDSGGLVEIRRDKNIQLCQAGNVGRDRNNDR
jgi:cytoskeletal protein RodZ